MWIHEVKTPIASSRLIIQNHQDEATASIAEELDKVEEYVEQVLYYSRSSNVEKDYIIRKFPLKDAVFPVVKKHYRDFTGHKIVLSVDNLEFEVFSDTKWLEFILNQIVTNSIKYAREERAFIKIEAFEQKENIVLTIKDNGIGITKRDLGRVFEKGFTGENGRKYAKSTGMGLYICKKLCDKMGLAMKLYSEEGKGTEVLISFPRSRMVRFES